MNRNITESSNYKDTPVETIPEGWQRKKLGDCLDEVRIISTPPFRDTPYVCLEHFESGNLYLRSHSIGKDVKSNCNNFLKGHILYGKLRPNLNKVVIAPFNGICSTEVMVLDAKSQSANEFLIYHILSGKFVEHNIKHSYGTKMPRTSFKIVKNYPLALPPLPEQNKIAAILSTVNAAIFETDELIAKIEQMKRGLKQELLTNGIGHTEFRESIIGRLPKEWDVSDIGEIFYEVLETSSNKEKFPLYSLTIENGLIPKTDRYERSFLMKNKEENEFKTVSYADMVYNPMNIRFGAITISKIEFAITVSNYYNIFRQKDETVDPWYYSELFQTEKYHFIFESVATGSLLEKKRVHWSVFKKIKVPYPPLKEQQKISKILKSCEDRLERERQYRIHLSTLKHGLMQDLLTGRIRVNVTTNSGVKA
jgi:type I restriction enzyme S subunit